MAENPDTISQEAASSRSCRSSRDPCGNDVTRAVFESARSISECIPCSLWMVVMRMLPVAEKKGLLWASISTLSLVLVLFAMTAVSGGFSGLSGTLESLAYAGAVMVPLLVVVFWALWKPIDPAKKEQEML